MPGSRKGLAGGHSASWQWDGDKCEEWSPQLEPGEREAACEWDLEGQTGSDISGRAWSKAQGQNQDRGGKSEDRPLGVTSQMS